MRPRPAPVLLLIGALLLGACSSQNQTATQAPPLGSADATTRPFTPGPQAVPAAPPAPAAPSETGPSTTATTATPTPTTATTRPRERAAPGQAWDTADPNGPASTLSGQSGGGNRRLLAVKIDNTRGAQPHVGLSHADLVYLQEVEGGLTRILALYATTIPRQIGPIRSARISDLDLLAPWPRIMFAYSGAQTRLVRKLAKAPLARYPESDGPTEAWNIDTTRPVWWNAHMLTPPALLRDAPPTARNTDTGWTFAQEAPRNGTPTRRASMAWDAARADFSWNAEDQHWDIALNGTNARGTETPTQRAHSVIVARVKQTDSGYGDRYGGRTPLIHSTGKGTGWLLRDGQRWPLTWTRPTPTSHWQWTLADGTPATLDPGQTWIVLLDAQRQPQFS